MSEHLFGAYSPYSCKISPEAKKAFEQATKGLLGVTYTPVAVSTQIVSGTNYRFFCNTEVATRIPIDGAAIVSIYASLENSAQITHIQTL